jgi:hypothetical protein
LNHKIGLGRKNVEQKPTKSAICVKKMSNPKTGKKNRGLGKKKLKKNIALKNSKKLKVGFCLRFKNARWLHALSG